MRITVEFDSLEEFQKYITHGQGHVKTVKPEATLPVETKEEEPAPVEEEKAPFIEMPASDPVTEAPTKIDESFRLEVRKELAALNRLQTGNPAKELIAQTGYKRLTDVPLDLLPELMQKAKEAMGHV